ncbi:unnamed protein product [Brachionus calyciflorus]|uniref:Beta-1,4-galactosyltransferase n=1 Tax=Brachionus calyciflorus TaxID=104777 RepID=A0A814NLX6_9BILA|nr:unnamed protein product [Brachionus calyciflorus]
MAQYRLAFVTLFALTFLNFMFIFNHLMTSLNGPHQLKENNCAGTTALNSKNKKIQLNFDIMDIYRIDVSCDYITRDLGAKISNEYANSNKKCSFSSKNSNINLNIKETLNKLDKIKYDPFLNASIHYDPFDNKTQVEMFNNLELGGVWTPKVNSGKPCSVDDLDHVVFIVPFSRSRFDNLKLFLINMHSYLQNYPYSFKYRILIVEQIDMEVNFNKGRLINAAVKHVIDSKENVDCIVIHDIDMIPSTDGDSLGEKGDYRCRKMPWHLSRKVFNLKTKEERIYNQFLTGGILSLRLGHFLKVNGFSNEYFGWGAEDDDFQVRMFNSNLCIMRPGLVVGEKASFMMLPHDSSKANHGRFSYLSNALIRQSQDGLSNIQHLVQVVNLKYLKSFTYLAIKVSA